MTVGAAEWNDEKTGEPALRRGSHPVTAGSTIIPTVKTQNINQSGHGAVLPELSEYTSRQCRMTLARLCIEAAENPDMGLSDPRGYIATQLNVTKRTVRRWRGGGIQSCNVNADKLIELAYRLSPDQADDALREDLELHRIAYINGQPHVRPRSTLAAGGETEHASAVFSPPVSAATTLGPHTKLRNNDAALAPHEEAEK